MEGLLQSRWAGLECFQKELSGEGAEEAQGSEGRRSCEEGRASGSPPGLAPLVNCPECPF